MRRYLLTLLSTVVLLGLYTVYGQVASRLITRAPLTRHVLPSRQFDQEQPTGPRESHEIITRYLPEERWAQDARIKIQADGLHLFFDERAHENSNTEIRVSPVAIVWMPPESKEPASEAREPLIVLAESATFRFDEPVGLSDIRTHMIRQIMLRGQVQIRGENGLQIRGSNFTFSRDSQHLFSDHPLQFQMQEHRGYARNIQLNLEMLDGGSYSNNPRILGIEELVIRDRLELHLAPENSEPVLITCEDRFQYHFKHQQAMLLGDVYIRRAGPAGMVDDLNCERLTLLLEKLPAEAAPQNVKLPMAGSSKLQLKSLHAEGEQVRCRSQLNQLEVTAQKLSYDVLQRTLQAVHEQVVTILYQGADLLTPQLNIRLDEQNQPQYVHCAGPGQLKYASATPKNQPASAKQKNMQPRSASASDKRSVAAQAHWNESLVMETDPLSPVDGYVVTLTGPASLSAPAHQAGLMAKTIQFWMVVPQTAMASRKSSISASATEAKEKRSAPEGLKISRALAVGEVAIASPQLDGVYESLELTFTEDHSGQLEKLAASGQLGMPAGKSANPAEIQLANAERVSSQPAAKPRLQVDARELKLNVLHDENFERLHLAHVQTVGEMKAAGQIPDQQDDIEVSGQGAEIFNDGGDHQRFRLLGAGDRLAWIRNGLIRIDGIDLYVDRSQNHARVHGGGSLQLPVNADWEGSAFQQAELLQVSWREQMRFDGQSAHFIGHVRASIGDSIVTCEELIVSLDQPISLQTPDRSQRPRLTVIECRDRVRFEMNHYEESRLTGVRYLNVASFKVDHLTGDMSAQGPGAMEVWQRRTGQSPLGLPEAGMTKGPRSSASAADGWDYTRLTFAGSLEGNIHQQQATITDRINVLHGPVDRPLVSFERDDRPKNSVWMRCGTLGILIKQLKPAAGQDALGKKSASNFSLELQAKQNAEIEGDRFFARADLISYDHQSNLFVMRALENRHATLWYSEHPQAPRSQSDVKMVRISPNGNFLELDRTLGASSSR